MLSIKNGNQIIQNSPNVLKVLFLAARPKTWSASLAPVLLGTALAARAAPIEIKFFVFSLLFSFFLQIGTNYANDYFDAIKGADTPLRTGPKRAVQQGWISAPSMRLAALGMFILAFACAIPLIFRTGFFGFFVVFFCIVCGWFYTGGEKPLGYLGLGELLVFIFFGPVAVMGTYFLQTKDLSLLSLLVSLSPGALSSAILLVNNLRDEWTDRAAQKKTFVVRFGPSLGRKFYLALISLSFLSSLVSGLCLGCKGIFFAASLFSLFFAPFSSLFSSDFKKAFPQTSLVFAVHILLFCYAIQQIN